MKDRPLTARRRSRAYQQALAALRDRHPAEFAAIHAAIRLGLDPERVATPPARDMAAVDLAVAQGHYAACFDGADPVPAGWGDRLTPKENP